MTIEVGTAVVNLIPSARGFAGAIRSELSGKVAAAGQASGDEAGSSWASAFSGHIGRAVKVATVGLGALGVAAAGFGIKVAADNEQAQISFETMLGSADKARVFIKQLQDFAARTPFDFPGLQQSASQLIAVGINADKVIPIMTALGNITSGMGTGAEGVRRATVALQQMNAAGRISAQDLNQLRDAGVPVFDLLSRATGKTTAQLAALAQEGGLGRAELDKLMQLLESGQGLERFNGLMDKQSLSLKGLLSTFKDTFGQGLALAMAPAMPAIKDALGGVNDVVQASLTGGFGAALSDLSIAFVDTFKALLPLVAPLIGDVANLATHALRPLLPIFERLAPPLTRFVEILANGLGEVIGAVLPPLGDLLVAVTPLLEPLAKLAATVGAKLAGALARLLRALLPILDPLVRLTVLLVERIGAPAIIAIADAVVGLADGLGTVATFVGRVLDAGVGQLVGWFEKLGQDPSAAWGDLLAFFKALPGRVVEAVGSLGTWLWDHAFAPARDFLAQRLPGWQAAVAAWFSGLPDRIVAAVGTVGDWLMTKVFDPARRFLDTRLPAWRDDLVTGFEALPDLIGQAVEKTEKLGPWLWDHVFAPARDYLAGTGGKGGKLAEWNSDVGQAFSGVPGAVKKGIESGGELGDWLWVHVFHPAAGNLVRHAPEFAGDVGLAFAAVPAAIVKAMTGALNLGETLWSRWLVPALRLLVTNVPMWTGELAASFVRSIPALIVGINQIGITFQQLPLIVANAIGNLGQFLWDKVFLNALSFLESVLPEFFAALARTMVASDQGVFDVFSSFGEGIWAAMAPGFDRLGLQVLDKLDVIKGYFRVLPGDISAIFREGLTSLTGTVGDIGKDLWNDLAGFINDNFVKPIRDFNVPGFGNPFGTFPLMPMLAGGGPLAAGQPAIVGERGPEMWWPNVAGRIVPAADLAALAPAAGGGLHIEHLEVHGADQPAATAWELRRELRRTAFFGGVTF